MAAAERKGARGFTIIELMVVTLIIAILMSVAFKISGIGDDADSKNRTIARLQKLENCLSGYYAVYGMYPPVPLQGVSRSIYVDVDEYGIQGGQGAHSSGSNLKANWSRVNAACKAQPVSVIYPYPHAMSEFIKDFSDLMERRYGDEDERFKKGFENASDNPGKFNDSVDTPGSLYRGKRTYQSPDWNDCQLFRYGLMSFLLPRYLFMLGGHESFYNGRFAQWSMFNNLPPSCKNGKRIGDTGTISSWSDMVNMLNYDERTGQIRASRENLALVESIPSQSVCRRWIANLEGAVSGGEVFFGVNTRDDRYNRFDAGSKDIPLYRVNGQQYVLGEMTVCDGWGRTLYYYSEPPYQSYRLWSAGKDGRTFPPWLQPESLSGDDKKTALEWMADDIIMMSN